MVPIDPAYSKGRHIAIQAAGEYEIVHCIRRLPFTCAYGEFPQSLLPISRLEIKRMSHGRIPAPSHHEKSWRPAGYTGGRVVKGLEQYDVAIRVTKEIMPGNILGADEDIIETLGAKFSAPDTRQVPNIEFLRKLCGARFVSQENHLTRGMQAHPAARVVPVIDRLVAPRVLGGGEQRP